MLAARWEPWTEMNRISREMERLFHRSGDGMARALGVGGYPALNVWEDGDSYYAEAELPGVSSENLEVYVTGKQLTIKGARHRPEFENGIWHRQERDYGEFSRMVELPGEVNNDGVTADFQNGVLKLTLPKSESLKSRRVPVTAK